MVKKQPTKEDRTFWDVLELYASRVFFPYTAVGNFPINAIGSLYGIFTYIYSKNQPNVAKYTSPMDPMGMARYGSVDFFGGSIDRHQSNLGGGFLVAVDEFSLEIMAA